jgi:hypothetical protein
MRKISPTTLHTIVEQAGMTPRIFLTQLLVAKKLFVQYGMQLTKPQTLDVIGQHDQQLAVTLHVLREIWCKSMEDVTTLLRDLSRHEDFFLCDVDASQGIDENTIDQIIETSVHKDNIYTSKTLSAPGLHITTNSHRYGRNLSDDLDSMLSNVL